MNKRKQLNKEFKYKGSISLRYKNEYIGMLPEIHRLKAYEEEKCSSIYEYATKKRTRLTINYMLPNTKFMTQDTWSPCARGIMKSLTQKT